MAVQWSTTLRNALLDFYETTIGTSAKVMFYTGTMPANVAAATTGTKLGEFDLAADWMANASGGSKAFNSVTGTTGLANGTLGYYRLFASDGTTVHEQGTVTATGGGGDLTVDNTNVATGQAFNITSWSKTAPGA